MLRCSLGTVSRSTVPSVPSSCTGSVVGSSTRAKAARAAPTQAPLSLSDLIAFESDLDHLDEAETNSQKAPKPEGLHDPSWDSGSQIAPAISLPEARPQVEVRGPAPRPKLDPDMLLRSMFNPVAAPGAEASSAGSELDADTWIAAGRVAGGAEHLDLTRGVLSSALSSDLPTPSGGSAASGNSGGLSAAAKQRSSLLLGQPDWAVSLFEDTSLVPQALKQALPSSLEFGYAEAALEPAELALMSEEEQVAARARSAILPPLQSVLEFTTAMQPPQREAGAPEAATALAEEGSHSSLPQADQHHRSPADLAAALQDGRGMLMDGTRYEKLTGVDTGVNGYAKRWTTLRGMTLTADGLVTWEETVWEASDRCGLRELGAVKSGSRPNGAAWREEWTERLYTHTTNLRLVVERTAHKWARDASSDEWEEKWGEYFEEAGRVVKFADKWAKQDINVWHEKWGEDYDGRGACQKYTDKWAERLLPDGAREQWGDKWCETFGDGKGSKHGEVWSSNSWSTPYNRWWNEEHCGDGQVRKYGNSTSGEYWDSLEHMDTYYNPIPHFGFHHAIAHSPDLWRVKLPAPSEVVDSGADEGDGLGPGLGRL